MTMDVAIENDKPKRASVEYLVNEIFHDFFSSENGDLPFSGTKGHSHTEQIENYEIAVSEINDTRKKIEEGRAKHEGRLKKIARDSRAVELIRLKRRPIHDPLESSVIEKYALLDADDLLPNLDKRNVDFRLNDSAKNRWSNNVSIKSDDSLFKVPEIPAKTVRTIETISHQRKKSKPDQTSLHSSESSEKKSKIRRSIIKNEPQKVVLVARPSSVEFKNFIPQQIYEKTIAIKNVSKKVAKFQLEARPGSSKFSIQLESRFGNGGSLAPGIRVKMLVKFSSDDSEDYEERIVVRIQSAKDAIIFLRAYREPPVLRGTNYRLMIYKQLGNDEQDESFEKLSLIGINGSCEHSSENSWNLSRDTSSLCSSETSESSSDDSDQGLDTCGLSFAQFECSKCFVGEQIIIMTRLKNFGGDGKFFIMSEIDWNSMSIDDVTSQNLIVLSCFAMWPVYFSLKRNEEIDLITYFSPNSRGVQVDKLYMVCDNLAIHPIELLGDGVMYDSNLIKIDQVLTENSSGDRESGEWLKEQPMEGFDYNMHLIIEGDDEIVQETLKIVNSSPIEMYYRWEKSVSGTKEREEKLKNWQNLPHDLVAVYPESGIIRACESITFKISLRLRSTLDDAYRIVLRFVLVDIPLAAVPLDYDDFTETCTERRRICETSVDVRAKEIAIWARFAGYPSIRTFASGTSYENVVEDDRNSDAPNTKFPTI